MNAAALALALAVAGCGSESRPIPTAPRLADPLPAVDKHQRIVFESAGDIYSMDSDGGSPQRLTKLPGTEYLPSWSPDGTKVAFLRAVDGITSLWVVQRD